MFRRNNYSYYPPGVSADHPSGCSAFTAAVAAARAASALANSGSALLTSSLARGKRGKIVI